MNLKFDIDAYFKWYAEWIGKPIADIKSSNHPLSMLSDWLDIISLKVDQSLIGKKVYFSVSAGNQRELTNNAWLEGCKVICGTVENVYKSDQLIKIDGEIYALDSSTEGIFFEDEIHCILTLNYDGDDFIQIDTDGTVVIEEKYINNLIFFDEPSSSHCSK